MIRKTLTRVSLFPFLLFPLLLSAQEYSSGSFALGIRNTLNIFPHNEAIGIGAGGQFKIGFSDRVNTEWFLDYITSDAGTNAFRQDYHIGWSVQFVFPKTGFGGSKPVPYLLGGQCFDLTRAGIRGGETTPLIFSAAAQAGLGLSQFIGEKFELTFQTQYMVHLTKDIHIDESGAGEIQVNRGANFEGHLLLTFSANFYFLDLWSK